MLFIFNMKNIIHSMKMASENNATEAKRHNILSIINYLHTNELDISEIMKTPWNQNWTRLDGAMHIARIHIYSYSHLHLDREHKKWKKSPLEFVGISRIQWFLHVHAERSFVWQIRSVYGICNKMLCHSHSLSLYMADSNLFLKCYRINIIPGFILCMCFLRLFCVCFFSLFLARSLCVVLVVFLNTLRRYFATIVSP